MHTFRKRGLHAVVIIDKFIEFLLRWQIAQMLAGEDKLNLIDSV